MPEELTEAGMQDFEGPAASFAKLGALFLPDAIRLQCELQTLTVNAVPLCSSHPEAPWQVGDYCHIPPLCSSLAAMERVVFHKATTSNHVL